jgi:hypothetical protein
MTTEQSLSITTAYNATGITLVFWRWGKRDGFLTPGEAIDRAMALINAAAVSESEATIAGLLAGTQSPLPVILGLIRTARSPMLMVEGAHPIYGLQTKQPLVECYWYGDRVALTLEDARQHARCLLEAAESARTDNFLANACQDEWLFPEVQERIFERFRDYRQHMEK